MANNTSKVIMISCSCIFVMIFLCFVSSVLFYIFGLGRPLGPIDFLTGGPGSFTVINDSGKDICDVYVQTAAYNPRRGRNQLQGKILMNSESYHFDNIPIGKYYFCAEVCDKSVTYCSQDVSLDENPYTWYIEPKY